MEENVGWMLNMSILPNIWYFLDFAGLGPFKPNICFLKERQMGLYFTVESKLSLCLTYGWIVLRCLELRDKKEGDWNILKMWLVC